jgi:DNA-binding MarR family transcriptional regulator
VKNARGSKNETTNDQWDETLTLILFVHLAIAADADKGLLGTGLNRTHHRILFLVAHRPGVTVGEIVTLLRLTPQAVQVYLRTLLDNNLVEQSSSEEDRRRRHLSTTARGKDFLALISRDQYARIASTLGTAGPTNAKSFINLMRDMLDESDRNWLYPKAEQPRALIVRKAKRSAQ